MDTKAKKGNWFVRHKVWTVILVVIAIELGGHMLGLSGKSTVPSQPVSEEKPVAKVKITPTPTPNDPCWQYAGTAQIQQCAQMQDALEKGKALQYPLKATVTADTSSVYVTNKETNKWDDCVATVDDTNPEADNYTSDQFTLAAGQTERIGWATFINNESLRFDFYQTSPHSIDLDCTVNGQEHRSIFTL